MGPLVALGLRLLGGGAARGAVARGAAGAVEKESLKGAAKKLGKEFLKDKLESAGSKTGGPKFNISRNLGMMGSKFESSGGNVSGGSASTQGMSVAVNVNNNATGSASNLSSLNKQMNTIINLLASIDGTLKTQLKLQSNIISASSKSGRESNLEGKPADGLASMVAGGEAGGEAGQGSAGGGIMKTVMGLLKSGSIIGALLPLLVPMAAILAGGAFAALKNKNGGGGGGGGDYEAPEEYSRDDAPVVTPNAPATSPVAKIPENLALTPQTNPIMGSSLSADFMNKMKSSSPTNVSAELYETSKLATGGSTPVVNKPTTSISNPWVKPATEAELLPGVSGGPKAAYEFFLKKGYSKEAAAGIVGNLQAESTQGLNPNSKGEDDVAPGIHSWGIAQWNRERWDGLQAFAKARNKPWNDFYTQLEYVDHELNTNKKHVGNELKSGRLSPEEAAELVNRQYEVSRDKTDQRARNARNLIGGKFAPPSKGRLHGTASDGTPGSSKLFGGWDGTLSSLMSKMGIGDKSGGSPTAEKVKTETPKLTRNDPGMTSGLTFKPTDRALDLAPKIEPKVPTPTLRPSKSGATKSSPLGRNRVSTKDVPNPSASNIIREYQLYFTSKT